MVSVIETASDTQSKTLTSLNTLAFNYRLNLIPITYSPIPSKQMTSDQDFMFGGEAQVPDHCMIDDGNWNSLMDYDSFMTLDDLALDHFLASLDEDQMPSRILQAGADRVERPQAEQDRAEKVRADKERAEPQVGLIHKFSAQKPSAQKLPALKGPSHPGSRYDACIEEAFSNENLKQNLLRQSYIQPPSTDYPDDRLHYLVQTLALTQRFSRLHLRWWKMPVKNWIPELQLLLKAVNDPASGLTLWTPLDEVLTLIEKTLKDENLLTTKARQLNRSSMRWTIAAVMKKIVERKTDEVEEELPALLEKKGMNARLATKYVVDTVLQDCEDRGSLMLGSVPGFSEAFRRQSVSSNWSWTD